MHVPVQANRRRFVSRRCIGRRFSFQLRNEMLGRRERRLKRYCDTCQVQGFTRITRVFAAERVCDETFGRFTS
jgi:hypothetical protein